MSKDVEKEYQRGEVIVFRGNDCVDDSCSKILLIGIVERVDPVYTIVTRETVSCSSVLQILIIGKYKPTRDYIKHVDNSDSSTLPFALKNYRRELLLDEIQKEKETNESTSLNEFKEKCNRVKAVDHIFTGSRILSDRSSYKISEEYKTAKIKIRQTNNIHSPGECRQKVHDALSFLEAYNRNVNSLTILLALSKWHTHAYKLTSSLQNNSAILIQKNVRRYVARRKYIRRKDRFFGYYVDGRSKDSHEIRPGVFLSTQAKADEWFALLQISGEVILKHLKIIEDTSTAIAVYKWKESINLQQLETTKMRDEEIFSFF
ncbi:predicted protein [Chaetoceros tenuissimus]|uniref:Uncharacterized protein n=1 Tax=Chaetoceros tenuissimus TaxID=426638 RepID=A0AAD3D1G4_9STRA|nr:predicted protein [Chaetoceros tenuissimus]